VSPEERQILSDGVRGTTIGREAMGRIVELDGDEMTRILWSRIKEELLLPYLNLDLEYYDLGLENRDATDDAVTLQAARAIRKHGVGVKCATITPNADRLVEYGLKRLYPSPNATIRSILDGTIFRAPIVVPTIPRLVPGWKQPITIARHAHGDVYMGTEYRVPGPGKAELLFSDGFRRTVCDFPGPGVLSAMYNLDDSVQSFARSCMSFALSRRQDLWFSCKDTISKQYDGRFRDIFRETFESEFQERFEASGIQYFYTLIDDAVARVIRSEGGFVWALKNYDGDVMSDMVAAAFGSLALMTSILVSPDGVREYEAAHGTVTRHYRRHLQGEKTSTNPVATIFAWTGALARRGELDGDQAMAGFAARLEEAVLDTIESGVSTRDLGGSADTDSFLAAVRSRL